MWCEVLRRGPRRGCAHRDRYLPACSTIIDGPAIELETIRLQEHFVVVSGRVVDLQLSNGDIDLGDAQVEWGGYECGPCKLLDLVGAREGMTLLVEWSSPILSLYGSRRIRAAGGATRPNLANTARLPASAQSRFRYPPTGEIHRRRVDKDRPAEIFARDRRARRTGEHPRQSSLREARGRAEGFPPPRLAAALAFAIGCDR